MQTLSISGYQCNPIVGDVPHNTTLIVEHIKANPSADILVFPELALTGYPPEDLLFQPTLKKHIASAITDITKIVGENQWAIVGHPSWKNDSCYNELSVIHNHAVMASYQKQALPNNTVFDEKRYFTAGNTPLHLDIKGRQVTFMICEDIWSPTIIEKTVTANTDLLIVPNASPYTMEKNTQRNQIIESLAKTYDCHCLYLNQVGGQDELVFDGNSFVTAPSGIKTHVAKHCVTDTINVTLGNKPDTACTQHTDSIHDIYEVIKLGIHDYVKKNNFPGVLIGLSGGIDSALTLALAVDALGKDAVHAVMMPTRHTSDISLIDAKALAANLGCRYDIIDVEPSYQAFIETLSPYFNDHKKTVTQENMQARCRGLILMALSNEEGKLVLTTSNKSETAVGYSTLYGDMAGGFAPLKDLYKTLVYQLCNYRNAVNEIIPSRILTRPPSAELADNQCDQDSLPDYPTLDAILKRAIENTESFEQIVEAGFDSECVKDILNKVDRNEHKRRQAPIGIRLTSVCFGKSRRFPITQGFSRMD